MGAGLFPAGLGGAGLNPVAVPEDVAIGLEPIQYYPQSLGVTTPLVLAYNPTVPGFVQNADGTLQGVHPIDQQVALAVFFEYGKVPSAPTLGAKWRTVLSRIDPQKAPAIARMELNRCLAPLVAQNAIAILAFSISTPSPGTNILSLSYTNLLDPRYNPNNPALPPQLNPARRVLTGNLTGS